VRILVACSSTSTTPALLSHFRQPLPARASGPLAPGPRADSTPPLRFPSQPARAATAAAAAAARSLCHGCPVPDTFLRYRRRRRPVAATTPPHSTSCHHQPVSPASPGPLRYAHCPVPPPLCSLTPPAVYASATAIAAAPVAAFTLLSNDLPSPARAPGLRPPPGTHATVAAAARGECPGYPRPRHDLCRRRRRSRGCFNPTTE
jgi:hypothetical protein